MCLVETAAQELLGKPPTARRRMCRDADDIVRLIGIAADGDLIGPPVQVTGDAAALFPHEDFLHMGQPLEVPDEERIGRWFEAVAPE